MRLIDADALLTEPPESDGRAMQVNADPVKVGYLIEGRYPNDFKCSVCGQVFRDDIIWIYDIEEKGHQKFPPEYCPECGVKWKGCEFIDYKT